MPRSVAKAKSMSYSLIEEHNRASLMIPTSKIIFEIMNEGEQTIYNVVPMVTETTGMKRIYISPPVMVEQIAPHNGVKYTATISAGERIKTGNVTIRVAVADGNGQQYDWQEFSLPTER